MLNAAGKQLTFVPVEPVRMLLSFDGADGSNAFADAMGHAFTLIGTPTMSTAAFKFGTSSYLGSITSGLKVVDGSDLTIGNTDFTIRMWIRTTSSAAEQFIFDSRPGGSQGVYPTIKLNNGKIIYYVAGAIRIQGAVSIATNTWYHLAISRKNGETRMFIDGVQDGSTYTDANTYLNAPNRPMIGSYGFSEGTLGFIGNIDDLEMRLGEGMYNANFITPARLYPPKTNFDPYWDYVKLLMHGDSLTDVRGNVFTASGTAGVSSAQAKVGTTSLTASGNPSYLKCPVNAALALGDGDFTIEFWHYPTAAIQSNGAALLSYKPVGGFATLPMINYGTSGQLEWSANAVTLTGSRATYVQNAWQHVCLERISGVLYMFVDGENIGSVADTTAYTAANGLSLFNRTDNLSLGGYRGYMDEIRITVGVGRYLPSGFVPRSIAAPEIATPDPLWSQVALQLQFNGATGSAAVTDDKAHAITVAGSGVTIQNSSGSGVGGYGQFNGTSGYLDCGTSTDYTLPGDFCIELRLNPPDFGTTGSPASNQCLIETRSQSNLPESNRFVITSTSTGALTFTDATDSSSFTSSLTMTAGAWNSVCYERVSGVITCYVNGVAAGTFTNATSYNTTSSKLVIGALAAGGGGSYPRGFRKGGVDQVRITKAARYKKNYQPSAVVYGVA